MKSRSFLVLTTGGGPAASARTAPSWARRLRRLLRHSAAVHPIRVGPHVPARPGQDEEHNHRHHDPHGQDFGPVTFLLCHRLLLFFFLIWHRLAGNPIVCAERRLARKIPLRTLTASRVAHEVTCQRYNAICRRGLRRHAPSYFDFIILMRNSLPSVAEAGNSLRETLRPIRQCAVTRSSGHRLGILFTTRLSAPPVGRPALQAALSPGAHTPEPHPRTSLPLPCVVAANHIRAKARDSGLPFS